MTITGNLDWGQHVSDVSTKATQTLGFLRRNLGLAPREIKDMAYKTLVRPYSKLHVYQLEKVQRTAARWTCKRWRNTSHVSDMLNELDWPALEDRREQASLAFFHKKNSGNVAIERNKYLTPVPRLRQTRASHELQYIR